jgi:acyl-CoA thioester hydrolase
MIALEKEFEIKWADIDANRHLRHSAYYDYGAHMRVKILEEIGLSVYKMAALKMGPILFREEAKFLREVGMQDTVTLNCKLVKARADGSRWSFIHEVYKQDGTKSAIITVDGAWMDIDKRKLMTPPADIAEAFLTIDRAEDFEWV